LISLPFPAAYGVHFPGSMSSYSNPLTEYSPQMEYSELHGFPRNRSRRNVFSEEETMEMAAELLEVRDEEEFDQFLGDLIHKAGNALGKIVSSPLGQAVGGVLKGLAAKALPLAGAGLGGLVGGPLGAQIGGALASSAGSMLGLELEGLSPEDSEFAAAQQFVKFAGEATRNALELAPAEEPNAAAHQGATQAAQSHAPGLMPDHDDYQHGEHHHGEHHRHHEHCHCHGGRWIRRERTIILLGV
jgi:hypothetical protein